jgi:pyruvate,water dikinase
MLDASRSAEQLLEDLQERAKELNCLYRVDEILSGAYDHDDDVFAPLLTAIPPGWKYPDICQVRIAVGRRTFQPPDYVQTPWSMHAHIQVHGEPVGEITVSYTQERPKVHDGPFLREEQRLISAIAERVGLYLVQRQLREDRESWESVVHGLTTHGSQSWKVLVEFLLRTDQELLKRITRKMINHLFWSGVNEAGTLLQDPAPDGADREARAGDENRPQQRHALQTPPSLIERTFELAGMHLSETEIVSSIQTWINEDNCIFLIQALENQSTTLNEIVDGIQRYENASFDETMLSRALQTSLKVGLLRRIFLDQLDFINVAKRHVEVRDFYDLVRRVVYPARSQGKLGGKAAGLFLAAKILKGATGYADLFANLKIPKTWHLASDGILDFIQSNNLNEVYDRKYMEVERVRRDYPYIIQVFKNSTFPLEISQGLSAILDQVDDRPLIVRSSSMLEDRAGASFSGKYKSLFLANQGSKKVRLEALQDAVAEIWASVFGPDPIEYRAARGLLDFREEMGILIQEVVGTRIGKYFLPAFSGVAFSNNEFRWSPRIKREDGLVRMVPGLGTRAVDRVSDDYPILFSPGQPNLRVNVTVDEFTRYSPKRADVINLESNAFETIDVEALLREHGDDYPLARRMVSLAEGDRLREPMGLEPDWAGADFVITFEGLLTGTPFVTQIRTVLRLLHDRLGTPVDVEFACDGTHLYILQCRGQSGSEQHAPAAIPRDLPRNKILFSANRYVANGRVPDITHIVYVDPEAYALLPTRKALTDVSRAVGALNTLLPKRKFVLIGPGRWGSRGDIKLGVNVTYSDINNTAMLMEVARKKGNYVPELSFGTHFFQDLVESDIRYLPLYPDEPDIIFQEPFFTRSTNILPNLLPEYAHLAGTLKVIDVSRECAGGVLRVLMNADLDEAVGILCQPATTTGTSGSRARPAEPPADDHWIWRMRMAEAVAAHLDAARFGVKGLYVFGSTKNASAGPASDIDLLVHFGGDDRQRADLVTWLAGWSHALAEVNFLRTGYRSDGLLDVQFVSDSDIELRSSYASKIGAVTDAAKPLALGTEVTDRRAARRPAASSE